MTGCKSWLLLLALLTVTPSSAQVSSLSSAGSRAVVETDRGVERTSGIEVHAMKRSRMARVGRYIRTHKLPVIADTVAILASAADAESTRHAQRVCPTCRDQGFWPHPTTGQIYFETMIGPALAITMNHLAYRHYAHSMPDGTPDKAGQRFFIALFTGPVVIHGWMDVRENAQVQAPKPEAAGATAVAQARRRLLAGRGAPH